jgi:ketosteroid isomerase-like protein
MPEQPATPDPVERVRRAFEAANRCDLNAVISFFASDTVFEGRAGGLIARLSPHDIDYACAAAERG